MSINEICKNSLHELGKAIDDARKSHCLTKSQLSEKLGITGPTCRGLLSGSETVTLEVYLNALLFLGLGRDIAKVFSVESQPASIAPTNSVEAMSVIAAFLRKNREIIGKRQGDIAFAINVSPLTYLKLESGTVKSRMGILAQALQELDAIDCLGELADLLAGNDGEGE